MVSKTQLKGPAKPVTELEATKFIAEIMGEVVDCVTGKDLQYLREDEIVNTSSSGLYGNQNINQVVFEISDKIQFIIKIKQP